MISFAKIDFEWLNRIVKNTRSNIKSKLVSKYIEEENKTISIKNTDINVLLNRVIKTIFLIHAVLIMMNLNVIKYFTLTMYMLLYETKFLVQMRNLIMKHLNIYLIVIIILVI